MEKIPVRDIPEIKTAPDFSTIFNIRNIHDLLAGEDMVQELHRHDFFYILVINHGSGNHEIDFTSYPVCDYSVFFMRPGQVHRLLLKTGSTGYLIQFKRAFYSPPGNSSNQLLCRAGNINHYPLTADGSQKLLAVVASIFQEYIGKQERYQEAIKANMDIFLIRLIRENAGSPSKITSLYILERFETFLEFLAVNVLTHKQVSQYAAMLNLSIYQLNAITKEAVGKTCSALINEYIILEAKRLLLATSNRVNQIAWHLGYEDISYFIRFFKKHTGYSPEAFRHTFQ